MFLKILLKNLVLKIKYRGIRLKINTFSSNISLESKFKGANKIGNKTVFKGTLGYGSYIGDNCKISADIGNYTSVASNVNVITATHPISKFVSTSPVFYSKKMQNGITYVNNVKYYEYLFYDKKREIGVDIGSDVWIAYGVTIVGGIKISDGAVILPNSTVVKDVLPFEIVGGTPAKHIKYRFDQSQIEKLNSIRWWEMEESFLNTYSDLFLDIDDFLNYFNTKNDA